MSRLEDKKHLRYVASLPCCLCPEDDTGWHDETVVPHHLLTGQTIVRGVALKADDRKVIPLCHKHHQQLHLNGDEADYLAQYGVDGVELANRLYNRS